MYIYIRSIYSVYRYTFLANPIYPPLQTHTSDVQNGLHVTQVCAEDMAAWLAEAVAAASAEGVSAASTAFRVVSQERAELTQLAKQLTAKVRTCMCNICECNFCMIMHPHLIVHSLESDSIMINKMPTTVPSSKKAPRTFSGCVDTHTKTYTTTHTHILPVLHVTLSFGLKRTARAVPFTYVPACKRFFLISSIRCTTLHLSKACTSGAMPSGWKATLSIAPCCCCRWATLVFITEVFEIWLGLGAGWQSKVLILS